MNCQETQNLLHGLVDGELEPSQQLEIERHLQDCQECAGKYNDLLALRTSLQSKSLYFQVPATLPTRIQASLDGAFPVKPISNWTDLRWWGIVSALPLVFLLGLGLAYYLSPPADDCLKQELVDSHARSLMLPGHQVDVKSSDPNIVKPWFVGKLNFSPPAYDLSKEGFQLVGGRLDYLGGRPVAVLVYQRDKQFNNLYIWPSTEERPDPTPKSSTRQGYQLIRWWQAAKNHWAVSNMDVAEMENFVQVIRENCH